MASSGSTGVLATTWDTLKFSWSIKSQSKTANTSTISWKMQLIASAYGRISSTASKAWSVTVDGQTYSGTNTIGISNNATKTLASGTTTIAHDANGHKKFSYSFRQAFAINFSGSYIGNIEGSGTGELDSIDRKSVLTVSDGTLGTAQTLTVTRYSSSFVHTIAYQCGSANGVVTSDYTDETSITFTPPVSLAAQNTTGTSVTVKYGIVTRKEGETTNIGVAYIYVKYDIPSSVKLNASLAVEDPTGLYDTYGAYIQSHSKFKVTLTVSTANAQGATATEYKTTANGKTYTSANFTTDKISNAGALSISSSVTDTRNRVASASKSVTVYAYFAPKITTLKVRRCDADGTSNISGKYALVLFGGKYVDYAKSVTYKLEYKKTSESDYTAITLTDEQITAGQYIFAAEEGSSYNIRLSIADGLETTSSTSVISTAGVIMHWGLNGRSMSIGKIVEQNVAGIESDADGNPLDFLDVGYRARFYGGFLHPVLEHGTDLNDVLIPNTYIGMNIGDYGYENCPATSGTFTLDVFGAGEVGQIGQRFTYCSKAASRVWERFYYQSGWGEWVCVSDFAGKLLWSGGYYMTADHTAPLAEPISKQRSGIVLVFSRYVDSGSDPYSWQSFFIPKYAVSGYNSSGHTFILSSSSFGVVGTKYLYIRDEQILGNENNNAEGTSNGITYNNGAFVLRYVIGV